MVQSLVDYIKKEVAQGYSVEQIKSALLKYGYQEMQIDEAIKKYNQQKTSKGKLEQTKKVKPKKQININYKKVGIISGAVVISIILIFIVFSLFTGEKTEQKETELSLKIESIETTITPGNDISFLKRISYSGNTEISFSYTLKDKSNNVVLTDYERLDIENSVTSRTDISTDEIEPGQYILEIIASYKQKEINKKLNVKVFEKSEEPSCFDNIQNQNETGIDCGGPCLPCEKCPLSCDDNNECTEDYCNKETNYQCVHDEIPGCGETTQSQQPTQPAPLDTGEEKSMYEIRKELYNTINTNPEQAINICNQITVSVEKDLCIKTVAELTNTSQYCSQITKQLTKDSCYMKFVINNNEFQHCDKIQDSYLKDSCLALEQINQIE
jgi:hypothetical protein